MFTCQFTPDSTYLCCLDGVEAFVLSVRIDVALILTFVHVIDEFVKFIDTAKDWLKRTEGELYERGRPSWTCDTRSSQINGNRLASKAATLV